MSVESAVAADPFVRLRLVVKIDMRSKSRQLKLFLNNVTSYFDVIRQLQLAWKKGSGDGGSSVSRFPRKPELPSQCSVSAFFGTQESMRDMDRTPRCSKALQNVTNCHHSRELYGRLQSLPIGFNFAHLVVYVWGRMVQLAVHLRHRFYAAVQRMYFNILSCNPKGRVAE